MIKIGRYTAALVLLAVGSLLLADQLLNTSYLAYLFDWWPLVLIALGAEYLILGAKHRQGDKPLKLDIGGVFFALLISFVVVVVTQSSAAPFQFLKNMNFNIGDFASSIGENGHKFDKDATRIPLRQGTEVVLIEDLNGSITLQPGDGADVEVQTTVFVDKVNAERAQEIADRSKIVFSEGSTLKIEAQGEKYDAFGGTFSPRMNLIVTLPKDPKVDIQVVTRNGKIDAKELKLRKELKANTTNGSITMEELEGNVYVETTNGRITLQQIRGDAELRSTNGSLRAEEIKGNVTAETTNGEIVAEQVDGSLKAHSTNGRIIADEVKGELRADTTNAGVTAESTVMGGDWELETTNGRIEVRLPQNASFRADGEAGHGNIESEFAGLTVSGKRLSGTVGAGAHELRIETTGSIDVRPIH
jgi:DUF4097 and DUF4098 domain-containing protein YvlB